MAGVTVNFRLYGNHHSRLCGSHSQSYVLSAQMAACHAPEIKYTGAATRSTQRAAPHPVVSQCDMKSVGQLDIVRYIYTFQSTVESSSSQTECFSLPIHSESCNMRLCYCVTADYCSHPCPDCRRTAWQRSNLHETARKRPACAPAVGFNSGSFGSATWSRDADADRCVVCPEPAFLSAPSSPYLEQLPSLRLLLGDALPPLELYSIHSKYSV